ncbi:hypothetical protein AY599_26005 [Leptolyngbya valderiana BDU 20041]|nr:hypothetical protein AY599_26005 [Leptolyngbya valderiana BDU 20041]
MRSVGVSVVVLLLSAGTCLAQNALGDGRALDRNTRVGGQGVNSPTRDYLAEMRFRNALVTGNVPGGAGFRGVTGYGLEYDFRQRVGSDDLFSFRRDSFTSGLAGTGIRGTEALQYQFALTVGNEPPRNLRGSLLTSRTGDRVTAGIPSYPLESVSGAVDIRQATPGELGEYEPGTALSLRSTSAYAAQRSLNPSMLYMQEDESGTAQGLVASPLRGLAREDLVGDAERTATPRDPAAGDRMSRDRGQAEQAAGQRERGAAGGVGAERALRDRLSEDFLSRTTPGGEPAEPAEGAGEGGQGRSGGGDPFLEQLSALQQVLREGTLMDVGAEGQGLEQGQPEEAMEQQVTGWRDLITTLKQGVGTVEVAPPKLDRASAYDLHIERGQAMMQDGRYFEAEQRFTMALAARPGDAIAAIGRVHAQIGAGLDLSAAVNLRAFLVEHPEFVGASYEEGMLPGQDRLRTAINRLSRQIRDESSTRRTRESALLLAYVSFQAGDRVSTILGLERLSEGEAGRRDPLTPLLRAVWLEDGGGTSAGQGEGETSDEDAGGG